MSTTKTKKPCKRCGGHGLTHCFPHVDGGRCFACGAVCSPEEARAMRAADKARRIAARTPVATTPAPAVVREPVSLTVAQAAEAFETFYTDLAAVPGGAHTVEGACLVGDFVCARKGYPAICDAIRCADAATLARARAKFDAAGLCLPE